MQILVVDDSATMRRIMRNLLMQIGFYNIDQASGGVEALAMLREGNYGLVLAEWTMEPMSGLQLLHEIRSDPKLKDLPFIIVTADSNTSNIIAAKDAGASSYIVKPFNAETLKVKIAGIFGDF
ncbi:response regulator [Sphingomonas sp. CJ20]